MDSSPPLAGACPAPVGVGCSVGRALIAVAGVGCSVGCSLTPVVGEDSSVGCSPLHPTTNATEQDA